MTGATGIAACVTDQLCDYALDALESRARRSVQDHIDQCPACAAELREVSDALALLALELPPVPPPVGARERLLEAVASAGRFDEFTPEIARLYGVSPDRARELLSYLDESARWVHGPSAGVSVLPIQAGPEYRGHMSSFLRVEAGATFPLHAHLGDEEFVVLQGACVESDARTFRRAEVGRHAAGTTHAFTVPAGGPAFIAAVRIEVGLRFVPASG